MKRLIKLSEDHYIVVEDSELKEVGIFVYDDDYEPPIIYKTCEKFFEIGKEGLKITHSFGKELEGVETRDLSEAKEIEYGYNLDKMVENYKNKKGLIPTTELEDEIFKLGYKDGFNAHKELTKDKVFTLQDLKEAFYQGHAVGVYLMDHKTKEEFEKFVESKKTPNEWEVDIIDGEIIKK